MLKATNRKFFNTVLRGNARNPICLIFFSVFEEKGDKVSSPSWLAHMSAVQGEIITLGISPS